MKRLVSAFLAVVLLAGMTTGCKTESERILYGNVDLSKIVELGEYKDLPVDTKSDTFATFYDEVLASDVENNSFYTEETLTEGKIENGDVANIDYTGKKDGVAFEGGTASAQDLEIGSGSFIPGFEEGLVGVSIGETVDLNLTFPKEYHSADLAGKAVVFTVKVNSAKRKKLQKPDEYFAKLGFKSVSEYNKDARKRAIENYLLETVIKNSKIKEYPETELNLIYETSKNTVEMALREQYNMDFAGYLDAIGQTEEAYKKSVIEEQIKPSMDVQMVLYAILDKEGLEFTSKEVEEELNKVVKDINNSSVTAETVKEAYGEYYFEETVVCEKVIDFIYKNAKLK